MFAQLSCKTIYFFSQQAVALNVAHPRHNPSVRLQSEPLFGLTGGLCPRAAHKTMLWRWCSAVLPYLSGTNPLLACVVHHGYSESMCSGIPLYVSGSLFGLGFMCVLMGGRIKENFIFLSARLFILTSREIGTALLTCVIVSPPWCPFFWGLLIMLQLWGQFYSKNLSLCSFISVARLPVHCGRITYATRGWFSSVLRNSPGTKLFESSLCLLDFSHNNIIQNLIHQLISQDRILDV